MRHVILIKHRYLLVLIVFCTLCISCKPSKVAPTQVANTITFTKNTEGSQLVDTTALNHFLLQADSKLAIEFTLDQPLVKDLQDLAPTETVDELLTKGNFQFTFKVDGKTVYVEDLSKGAGSSDAKKNQLIYRVPLIHPEPLDFWGWFMWLKFMKLHGGRDALYTGDHKLRVEVRGYVNTTEKKLSPVLAEGTIDVSVADLPYDQKLVPIQRIEPTQDFKIAASSYNYKKIQELNKKIAQGRFENINGIVVLKNNELLIEEYFNGTKRSSLHDARSVGKSIASTVMGIAIDEKYIKSENSKLNEFYQLKNYQNYSQKKEEVTIKSLLTMSSTFVGDDDNMSSLGNEELMYPTKNWLKFALDLPMEEAKVIEKDYSYFTAGVIILGDLLEKSVPNGLEAYTDKKLFKPLQINQYKWQYTPQGVANTAGGIQLSALDFAKFGQLYKNKGRWNGAQIVSSDWVEKSLSKQVKQPHADWYGYLFWNKEYTVAGKKYEVAFSNGNGGNKIFIFKDLPFVIVLTASSYNLPYAHSDADLMMVNYILPAILDY
ncbi:hypothetical protein GCM10011416_15700 [Polaribacter pacificus]|uniref:Beta-lactamase-related domain-containing protein n=1 Tax=Polaribacter pacificus TaxID=1775173 RepID=A0A917I0L7_9FLAO|nr:serine hydrolase [Polaribacter pacificus]GGG98424.1 hypothetical protein GCM10011416_15700 [Polaribacter pacificus]